jgi:hypothetical protein
MAATAAASAAGLVAEARAMRGGGADRGGLGAFRPRCIVAAGGLDSAALSLLSEARSGGEGDKEERDGVVEEAAEMEHRSSPNKRHRATPRPHNIQRPCLDFEKMQQVWILKFSV